MMNINIVFPDKMSSIRKYLAAAEKELSANIVPNTSAANSKTTDTKKPPGETTSTEKRKKPAKKLTSRNEKFFNPEKLPGFKGNLDVNELVEFVEGNSVAKRYGRREQHREQRSKSNEKELLVKSISLDDDNLCINARPMSERTIAGGSNREIVKRNIDRVGASSGSQPQSDNKSINTNSGKDASNINSNNDNTKVEPKKSSSSLSETQKVAVTSTSSSFNSNGGTSVNIVTSVTTTTKEKPVEEAEKIIMEQPQVPEEKERHDSSEFRTVVRKNKFKYKKEKDSNGQNNNNNSSGREHNNNNNKDKIEPLINPNSSSNNNINLPSSNNSASKGSNINNNNNSSNNNNSNSSSNNINSPQSPVKPPNSSNSSSPDLGFPPLVSINNNNSSSVISHATVNTSTLPNREWVNICVGDTKGKSGGNEVSGLENSIIYHHQSPSCLSESNTASSVNESVVSGSENINNNNINAQKQGQGGSGKKAGGSEAQNYRQNTGRYSSNIPYNNNSSSDKNSENSHLHLPTTSKGGNTLPQTPSSKSEEKEQGMSPHSHSIGVNQVKNHQQYDNNQKNYSGKIVRKDERNRKQGGGGGGGGGGSYQQKEYLSSSSTSSSIAPNSSPSSINSSTTLSGTTLSCNGHASDSEWEKLSINSGSSKAEKTLNSYSNSSSAQLTEAVVFCGENFKEPSKLPQINNIVGFEFGFDVQAALLDSKEIKEQPLEVIGHENSSSSTTPTPQPSKYSNSTNNNNSSKNPNYKDTKVNDKTKPLLDVEINSINKNTLATSSPISHQTENRLNNNNRRPSRGSLDNKPLEPRNKGKIIRHHGMNYRPQMQNITHQPSVQTSVHLHNPRGYNPHSAINPHNIGPPPYQVSFQQQNPPMIFLGHPQQMFPQQNHDAPQQQDFDGRSFQQGQMSHPIMVGVPQQVPITHFIGTPPHTNMVYNGSGGITSPPHHHHPHHQPHQLQGQQHQSISQQHQFNLNTNKSPIAPSGGSQQPVVISPGQWVFVSSGQPIENLYIPAPAPQLPEGSNFDVYSTQSFMDNYAEQLNRKINVGQVNSFRI